VKTTQRAFVNPLDLLRKRWRGAQTTQQTIGPMETGKAEPNLSSLRDLAMIFGTALTMWFWQQPHLEEGTTNTYTLVHQGRPDGYWGNDRHSTTW